MTNKFDITVDAQSYALHSSHNLWVTIAHMNASVQIQSWKSNETIILLMKLQVYYMTIQTIKYGTIQDS